PKVRLAHGTTPWLRYSCMCAFRKSAPSVRATCRVVFSRSTNPIVRLTFQIHDRQNPNVFILDGIKDPKRKFSKNAAAYFPANFLASPWITHDLSDILFNFFEKSYTEPGAFLLVVEGSFV